LWWVGWGLRDMPMWTFSDFLVLVVGSICIYGAAEMALPVPGEGELNMLAHNQGLGRLSAVSMLIYFAIGPYVNLRMYEYPGMASIVLPLLGALLMALVIAQPRWFKALSVVFSMYTVFILYLTA
jgi:hypothetical protein